MLTKLHLTNYRGFRDHTLPFRRFTIAVGENNAGKTTLVEALRLVSLVSSRYLNLAFQPRPDWLDRPRRELGVSPSLRNLEMRFDSTLFYGYSEPPAELEATFADGSSMTIFLGGDRGIHVVLRNPAGQVIRTHTEARGLGIGRVEIMPQVGPVALEETVLTDDYIRRSLSSPLAPRHFRNQLRLLYEDFQEFKELAEGNWSGLQVRELSGRRGIPGDPLYLEIRNRDFVGELSLMGHGLQMWLQAIWFLTRARGAESVILDEPDVYMHPDLQRRFVRLLQNRFPQTVVTTHSVEIMSEVQPSTILLVDRGRARSRFADTLPAVQALLDNVGSAQNIHLTRLWRARRLLLVEGDDFKILKRCHDLLFPESDSLDTVPNMPIGGWEGWPYAIGSSMAFRNAVGQEITTYCLLDSDYHTPDQINRRLEDARAKEVDLHIWRRKEIENYLLVPSVLSRILAERCRTGTPPSEQEVAAKLDGVSRARSTELVDGIANEFKNENRGWTVSRANQAARETLRSREKEGDELPHMVSGKAILADLSRWSQAAFGVGIGVGAILKEIRPDELPRELAHVLASIQRRDALPTSVREVPASTQPGE